MFPDVKFVFNNDQGIAVRDIIKVTDVGDTTCYELKDTTCVFVRKNWLYAISYPNGYEKSKDDKAI